MEIVTSTVASIITKIAESLVAPFGSPFVHLILYNSNIKDLQEQVEKLRGKGAGLKLDIEAAKRRGEVIAPGVESWLTKVDEIDEELRKFLEEDIKASPRYLNQCCPDLKSRYSLSRKAKKKIQEVVKLQENGKFDKTSYPAPLSKLGTTFTDHFMDFTSRILIKNEVLGALKDDMMNMIGICGMGGVGKTTLMKEVIKALEGENLFDEIVMVVVSQTPDTKRIQCELGDRIGLKLEEGSVRVRASRLHDRLKEIQRILIILDDVWAELDLEEIGIPSRDDHHGCKIVLASRMEDVCKKMKSQKNFRILVLSESEAWCLFREMAGESIDNLDIPPIAQEVARECGGLPIAIVTIAKALRDKDRYIWEDALQQLKKSTIASFSEMHEFVFSRIELSYKYLKNEELRSCFLLCSLFPEDFNIPVEHLVRYGVGLRLFKGIDSLGDARNRVYTIVDKLKSSFLLLDSDEEECVKMHDVVRDVAISIASRGKHKFLVRCDSQVKEWPNEDTYEHCTASSFVFEIIKECAGYLECPKLQLLQLFCRNPSQNVPCNLLQGMKELKVLALQGMSILSQPPSLQVLRGLRTLRLEHCELKDVFILGALENLEILSLVGSRISELPTEIGQLRRLKLLDVTKCSFIKGIPPGVLSLLSQLEELYMRESFYRWESVKEKREHNGGLNYPKKKRCNASVIELKSLSHLKALDIHMPNSRCLPKDMHFCNLTRFKISVSSRISEKGLYLFQNTLKFEGDASDIMGSGIYKLLRKTEVLSLNLTNLKNVLYQLDEDGFPCLKNLTVDSCSNLEYLIDAGDCTPLTVFPLLQSLSLCKLVNLREIWHGCLPERSLFQEETEVRTPCLQEPVPLRKESAQLLFFGQLRFLNISGCCKLKNVFSVSMARGLVQLQDFYIGGCADMEEILSDDVGGEITFPKLTNLRLFILQKLIGFCKGIDDAEIKKPTLEHPGKQSGFLELRSCETDNTEEIQGDHLVPVSHNLFTSQWMSRLLNLKKLELHSCELLQVVFDFETLNVKEATKIIHMPVQLEEISLYFMPELTNVWNKVPKGFQGFKRLKLLTIGRCNNLRYLFSPSIAKLFVELERINIEDCAMMENIVAREVGESQELTGAIIFHEVNSIHLRNLPKLVSFCPDPYIFEWPSLDILHLAECPKLKTFGSTIQCLIKPMLKGIKDGVGGSPIVLDVNLNSSDRSPVGLSYGFIHRCFGCSSFHPTKFGQGISKKEAVLLTLVDSNVSNVMETWPCVPFNLIHGHQHLQTLELNYCDSVEVIFDLKDNHATLVLNNFETLTLNSLPNLMQIWKMGIGRITGFQNLKQMEIHECNSLKNSIPLVIARLLVKLEVMKITSCELMEEIIAQGGNEEKADAIMFPQLNSIILSDLANLTIFCSEACAIEFPMLMTMKMVGCPKLETFVSANILTPRLKMILSESSSYPLRGDLNDTIQQIFKGKMLFEPIQDTLEFTSSNSEVGNDLTHKRSSIYRGDESTNGAKGGNEFEGERTLEDGHSEGYEAEVEYMDILQGDGINGKMQGSVDENEKGKQDKDALKENKTKQRKGSNAGDNEEVKEDNIRVDTRGKAKKEDEHIKEDNVKTGSVIMDDASKEEGNLMIVDSYRNRGTKLLGDNIVDYTSSDDASEGNVGTFLIPTMVVPEKDDTMLLGQRIHTMLLGQRIHTTLPTHETVTNSHTASTSQGNGARMNLTQFRIGAYAYFYGFQVESHYVSYLERFYNIEGIFWDSCIFKSSTGISFLLNMLGGALQTLDNVLMTLTSKELKLIRDNIEDVSKAGFRVDSLMPLLEKVRVIIALQERRSRYEYLEREMNALEVRLTEINQEMVTVQQELRSDLVGVDFNVNYFSMQYDNGS